MKINVYLYIFVMAFATWLMRVAASLIMKKPVRNRFFQSFLYYVPYVTLAVMTFPAIVEATQSPIAGAAALIVCIAAAWFGQGLFTVSVDSYIFMYSSSGTKDDPLPSLSDLNPSSTSSLSGISSCLSGSASFSRS